MVVATPQPRPLPLLAEVLVDDLAIYTCASEECEEVTKMQQGTQVEVSGCLADGSWCLMTVNGTSGWCMGSSLQQLAVAEAVPMVAVVLPTATPRVGVAGEGKIIFNSVLDGERRYYIINADGSGLTPFTEIHGGYGDWSPDGNHIVFSYEEDIYVMNADGSGLVNLTNHPAYDSEPTWSPDGRQILFRSNRDEPDPENCWKRVSFPRCNYEIYIMNADGSGLTNLTNDPGSDEDHAWLPDGRIIFSRAGNIYVINADGSSTQKLAEGNSPLLSPDGSRFVFFRDDLCCLWLLKSDGSGLTLLSGKLGAYTRSGRVWAPDGQKIAFAADLREYGSTDQIYVVDADGSNFMPLTNPPGLNGQPAWSPDGQTIAFVSHRDGNDEIYVMNADGSGQTRLTDRPDSADIFPRWSR
jgi:Tol biopolymer transport system component